MAKLISIGSVIDQTWDHYRANFVELLSISGWLLVLAVLEIISLALYPTATTLASGASLSGLETAGVILSFVTTTILTPLLGLWIFIALVKLLQSQLANKRGAAKQAMQEGWKLYFPALLVSILILLVLLGAVVAGIGPSFLIAGLGIITGIEGLFPLSTILLIIGFFVAFILSFKWGVEYILSPYALFLEDKKGVNALKRSKALIKGRFWQALWLLLIPKLVFIIVGTIAMAILAYFSTLVISSVAGLNLDLELRLLTITNTVWPIVIAALVNPLLVMADLLIYKSLMGGKK